MTKLPSDFFQMQLLKGENEDGQVGYRMQPWKQPPKAKDLEKQEQLFQEIFDQFEDLAEFEAVFTNMISNFENN